ncbi:multidrug efflux SMR transporter [Ideonella sp.]|uniref:DMT family transporter n=1 Tax=Ideonella sp. TaxID=1929293 RepID=UPI002B4755E2|nr:multidrug efflux SMR transporter [Ideonella sp.]HJV70477.1 multidrug efflux SMR transporter [Ideonella sp.]
MLAITSTTSAWLLILASGLLEIAFSVSMKLSDGYTRLVPSIVSVGAAILSVWLMGLTLKVIPVGTAYAVWAGIGAAGTAVVGMLLFQEPATLARIACIGLVVAGIVGLQLQAPV